MVIQIANRLGLLLILALLSLSPASPVVAQSNAIHLSSASGQPGEMLELEVRGDTDVPLTGFVLLFEMDETLFELRGFDVSDGVFREHNPVDAFFNTLRSGVAGGAAQDTAVVVGFHLVREEDQTRRINPGQGLLLGRVSLLIRADAPVGTRSLPLREDFGAAVTSFDTRSEGGLLRSIRPTLGEAVVITVESPVGPRPVRDLQCVQRLDEVSVEYSLTEEYDEIEVSRDGVVLLTVPGNQVAVTLPAGERGLARFEVVASRGGIRSLAAVCELEIDEPRAPSVTGLVCEEGLSWSNPLAYDEIRVLRDEELIATLDGTATGYADAARPEGLSVYEVVGSLAGFESEAAICIVGGEWGYEVPDVVVRSDATRVEVPIFATNLAPAVNFDMHLDISDAPLELVEDIDLSLEGTLSDVDPEVAIMGIGFHGVPSVGVIYDALPPVNPGRILREGVRQPIFRFLFDVPEPLEPGSVYPMEILEGILSIKRGTRLEPIALSFFIPGEIRVVDADDSPAAILDLAGAPIGGGDGAIAAGGPEGRGIRLTWKNARLFEALRVERNGEAIAELSGDAEVYLDENLPAGNYTYRVVALENGRSALPARTFVSTVTNDHFFLRGDTDRDHRVTLSDPIRTLGYLFLRGESLPCEDAADADDDGSLTLSDAVLTLRHLFLAGPPLPSPGSRVPWYDPTPDELGCGI